MALIIPFPDRTQPTAADADPPAPRARTVWTFDGWWAGLVHDAISLYVERHARTEYRQLAAQLLAARLELLVELADSQVQR